MNYRQMYAIKEEREDRIRAAAPGIPSRPGIYMFYRNDESGLRMAYVGQARKLCERCAQHLAEYDHIGLSLKKRGFYSDANPYGWKLVFYECGFDKLDEEERKSILGASQSGFQLYNVTSGGQNGGKTDIGERKPARGYRDGLEQGRKNLARDLTNIIEKHLTISIKEEKQNNKTSQKAYDKFFDLLRG